MLFTIADFDKIRAVLQVVNYGCFIVKALSKLIKDPSTIGGNLDIATWYFDGSFLYGRHIILRAISLGIAVVPEDGALLGYGWPRTGIR